MSRVNLTLVKGDSYFSDGRLSIGVYVRDGVATLIDSGIDKETAKAVDKALQEQGFAVGAIINTHHHPDHCGGNQYFQKEYPRVKIYTSLFESFFLEMPVLQPICFCNGAAPFVQLRTKYLEAPACRVTNIIRDYHDQEIDIDGAIFKILALPGHTAGSIGVVTPDNVFYCGDAMLGQEAYDKHGVMLYTNIADALATFDKIAALRVDATVFYHGGRFDDIVATAAQHRERLLATKAVVLEFLRAVPGGLSIDALTQAIMKRFTVPDNIMQFTLTRTSTTAYLTQLAAEGALSFELKDSLLLVTS